MNTIKSIVNLIPKKALLFLILVVSIVYYNSLGNDFVNLDDPTQVYLNSTIQHLNFEGLKTLFTSSVLSMYQPLTSLSFAGIASVFGVKSATPFHIFSFLLHILNMLLVYYIGIVVFKNKLRAIFLSLLFAAHPLAVEAVSWISATSTLLFSFFFLSALFFYIRYKEKHHTKHYIFSLLLFLIGCFCKVQIIPFVGVLFLVDYIYKKQLFLIKNILEKIPFIVVAIIFGLIALEFRHQELAKNVTNLNYSNLYFSIHQIGWYIIKLFAPFNYSIIYNWIVELSTIHHLYALVIMPLIYLVYRFRKKRLFIFGVLFFLMNLALHTTLFSKMVSPYASRYMYIASLGIWISLLSISYKRQFIYVGVISLVFLTILAKQRTKTWKNTKTLFESSLEIEPNLAIAHGNLGVIYLDSNPKKALQYFLKATQLEPDNAMYFNNVGYIYKNYNFKKAEYYYLKALKLNPNYVNSLNNIGNLYMKIQPLKAEVYFLKAIKLNANRAIEFYKNLGKTFKDIDSIKSKSYLLKALELEKKQL